MWSPTVVREGPNRAGNVRARAYYARSSLLCTSGTTSFHPTGLHTRRRSGVARFSTSTAKQEIQACIQAGSLRYNSNVCRVLILSPIHSAAPMPFTEYLPAVCYTSSSSYATPAARRYVTLQQLALHRGIRLPLQLGTRQPLHQGSLLPSKAQKYPLCVSRVALSTSFRMPVALSSAVMCGRWRMPSSLGMKEAEGESAGKTNSGLLKTHCQRCSRHRRTRGRRLRTERQCLPGHVLQYRSRSPKSG